MGTSTRQRSEKNCCRQDLYITTSSIFFNLHVLIFWKTSLHSLARNLELFNWSGLIVTSPFFFYCSHCGILVVRNTILLFIWKILQSHQLMKDLSNNSINFSCDIIKHKGFYDQHWTNFDSISFDVIIPHKISVLIKRIKSRVISERNEKLGNLLTYCKGKRWTVCFHTIP